MNIPKCNGEISEFSSSSIDDPYTHNLNILIIDENTDNIMENTEILDMIYDEIVDKKIFKKGYWFGENIDMCMYWKKFTVTPIQRKFMGDLFTAPIHSDKLLYDFTSDFLNEIENKIKNTTTNKEWHIVFHISIGCVTIPKSF